MDVLSESTSITIGLVIVIIGGVAWLTRLHFLAGSTREKTDSLRREVDSLQTTFATLSERLARIEVSLESLPKIERFLTDIVAVAINKDRESKV